MENKLTVKDVLEIVVKRLSNINVPVSLINQIGIPVGQSISEITECLRAISNAEEKKEGADDGAD
jgi:hypothetical protein